MTEYNEPTPEQIETAKAVSRIYGERGAYGLRQSFLADVDRATPGLPETERQAAAEVLYRAHMTRLADRATIARKTR